MRTRANLARIDVVLLSSNLAQVFAKKTQTGPRGSGVTLDSTMGGFEVSRNMISQKRMAGSPPDRKRLQTTAQA